MDDDQDTLEAFIAAMDFDVQEAMREVTPSDDEIRRLFVSSGFEDGKQSRRPVE